MNSSFWRETGESQVFCHKDLIEGAVPAADTDFDGDLSPIIDAWTSKYAATEEMHDAERFLKDVPKDKQVSARGIEVGHIFYFGTKYSERHGRQGTGSGRAIDHFADGVLRRGRFPPGRRDHRSEPRCQRPSSGRFRLRRFEAALINLKAGDKETDAVAVSLYEKLQAAGIDVLYDDTDERAGAKFATMDLIGIPYQLIVGPKGVKGGEAEIKNRKTGERQLDRNRCGAQLHRECGQGRTSAGLRRGEVKNVGWYSLFRAVIRKRQGYAWTHERAIA